MNKLFAGTLRTFWIVGTVLSPVIGSGMAQAQVPLAPAVPCDTTVHYGGGTSAPGSKVFTACGSQIKTRWPVLCGAGGVVFAWAGLDSRNVSESWIQTGYVDFGQTYGTSTDPDYEPVGQWYYVEWENTPNSVSHHFKVFAGPAEGSLHNYSVNYTGAGKWSASYGGGTLNITDTMPCAFYNAQWIVEPKQTNTHAPGTVPNHCTFPGCYVKDATHANQTVTQTSTPYKFTSSQPTTALTATSITGSEVDCWDPRDH